MTIAEYALLAFSSLFVIVDPIAVVPAFLAMTPRDSVAQRLRTARVACPPAGPGVRVDTFGYPGYAPSGSFDSMLAKVIVRSPGGFQEVIARASGALREFRVEGIRTNVPLQQRIVSDEDFVRGRFSTRFMERFPTVNALAGMSIATGVRLARRMCL